ncbi:hypothetical protein LOTGIDRAFT_231819 [Lottia gigantea]|uniref:Coactosin-like protein n=1 Tax=Lottia gigantea TaxID=225164 RepID=V4AGL8_LOTGI|nr:hypothetical protein LOTGIDRAFT_231819 [Lottia gigantea]ESO96032.1 hypothetical protein LOTGIDRAFT_231819 [Lottia gigantea]
MAQYYSFDFERKMSTEVEVVDGTAFTEAIKSVRNDSTDDTYAVFGHDGEDPNRIKVIAVGQDTKEIASYMDDSQILYTFARFVTKFDMSSTVKFVYIRWVGDKVPIARRGKYGVIKGSVEKLFDPYHILVETNTTEDLDTEKILRQLDDTAGIKSRVLENVEGRQERGFTQTQVPQRNNGPKFGVNNISRGGVKIDIDPGVAEAIQAVRNQKDNIQWVLASYQDGSPKGPIIVKNKGEGTVDELRENLVEDEAMYGLYRLTDHLDDIKTVKFVYIVWLGTEVKPMTRAKVSTHRGAMEDLFGQAHVQIFGSELSDITEDIVIEKVTSTSGSKSHVKE